MGEGGLDAVSVTDLTPLQDLRPSPKETLRLSVSIELLISSVHVESRHMALAGL